MFVATSSIDKKRINLLDPSVLERRESLKAAGRKGGLVCPHCGQELRVRLGEVRRPHFAHKSLEDCPFQKESAEVTEVKALLYGFLRQQIGCSVDMDVSLDGEDASEDLFLDVLVETERGTRFGYWVFDRNRRDRHILLDAAQESGIIPVVIHTGSMMAFDPGGTSLLLSKSLRDLIRKSPFDEGLKKRSGGHLHFLNDAGRLTTFRRLHCVHLPNVYEGEVRREAALQEVRFDPESGDFVVEEDVAERLERVCLEQEREEKKHREEENRKKAREERLSRSRKVYTEAPLKRHRPAQVREPQKPFVNRFNQCYPCKFCGVETSDWVQWLPSESVCVCRECNAKRLKG
jgi:hypothetical protein